MTRRQPSPASRAIFASSRICELVDIALIDAHGHHGISGLFLLLDVRFQPAVEFGIAGRSPIHNREQRAVSRAAGATKVTAEALRNRFGRGDAAVLENVGVFLIDLFFQPFEAALAHHELQARLVLFLRLPY